MKKYLLIIAMASSFESWGQLIIHPQLPPGGVVQKNQLWNLIVTNTGQSNVSASVTMTMAVSQTGEQILSASTASIILPTGTTMLNPSQLMPIQYHSSTGFTSPDPSGFLPPGNFLICYSFNSASETKSEKCIVINIAPLSPPQLVLPEDWSIIDSTAIPLFTWLPPTPLNIFNDLKYDLNIVRVNEGQAPADAIQLNIPMLIQSDISGAAMVYPMSAPTLETGVQYAWRVTAKNNETPVSNSETWVFTLGGLSPKKLNSSELPFVRLKKNGESGYAICPGKLKFAYINETTDTIWNITVYDINHPVKNKLSFNLDSIPLKKGLNHVQYNLTGNPSFIDKHIYLLELRNSRNEIWRMKFEYVEPQN